jgi:hypothetical protein
MNIDNIVNIAYNINNPQTLINFCTLNKTNQIIFNNKYVWKNIFMNYELIFNNNINFNKTLQYIELFIEQINIKQMLINVVEKAKYKENILEIYDYNLLQLVILLHKYDAKKIGNKNLKDLKFDSISLKRHTTENNIWIITIYLLPMTMFNIVQYIINYENIEPFLQNLFTRNQ